MENNKEKNLLKYKTYEFNDLDSLSNFNFPINGEPFNLIVNLNNLKYEFFCRLKKSDKLLVLSPGAVTREQVNEFKGKPYYNRMWEWEESSICINDTGRYVNPEIRGSWLVGTPEDWHLKKTADIIKTIANNIFDYNDSNRYNNIIFHGSSMGGSISFMLSILLKNSICIAEILQSNAYKQYPAIRSYLYNGLSDEEFEKYKYRFDIIELMKKEQYIPNAYLILDCTYEHDFKVSFLPFFEELDTLPYKANNNRNKIKIRLDGKNKNHLCITNNELIKFLKNVEFIEYDEISKYQKVIQLNEEYQKTIKVQEEKYKKAMKTIDEKQKALKTNEEKYNKVMEKNQELVQFKKDVYNSKSWKITYPLRKLIKILKL